MILYHRPSGTTHVVSPVVRAILEALDGRTLDAAGVLRAIEDSHAIEADAGQSPLAVIEARVHELASLGLIDEAA